MVNYTIADKIYSIPQYWDELLLGRYQKLMTIKLTDDIETNVKIISILSDMSEELIYNLPYVEFQKILKYSNFVFEDREKEEIKFNLAINDIDYKFDNDITKYSTRAYIDLDTLIKDTDNIPTNLHYIMSILYRPVDKDGKIETYSDSTLEERAEIFANNMTYNYVNSAFLFFCNLGLECLPIIQNYLEELTTKS